MGQSESKPKSLVERVTDATSGLLDAEVADLPDLLRDAEELVTELNEKIAAGGFKGDKLRRVREAQQSFDQAIQHGAAIAKKAAEHAERNRVQREKKRMADKLAEDARTGLESARDSWRQDLSRAKQEVSRWSAEQPKGDGYPPKYRISAEEIAVRLREAQAEQQRLEDLLTSTKEWRDPEIIEWFKKLQEQRRAKSQESERQQEIITAKVGDPRLREALRQMREGLKFDVTTCQDILISAELTDILGEPIEDGAITEALKVIIAPQGGVWSPTEAILAVNKAGFPEGAVKDTIIFLIKGSSPDGAGFGAALRACYPNVVVHGASAGFNITNATVRKFFDSVARVKTSGRGSDTGERLTTTLDRGEFSVGDGLKES